MSKILLFLIAFLLACQGLPGDASRKAVNTGKNETPAAGSIQAVQETPAPGNKTAEDISFDSFMGVKWGTSASVFMQTFKYKRQVTHNDSRWFYLPNFQVEGLTFQRIGFLFKPKEDKIAFTKENFDEFLLDRVNIPISQDQFKDVLEMHKAKYGEPHRYREFPVQTFSGKQYDQVSAAWYSKTRMILVDKYSGAGQSGAVILAPYTPKKK